MSFESDFSLTSVHSGIPDSAFQEVCSRFLLLQFSENKKSKQKLPLNALRHDGKALIKILPNSDLKSAAGLIQSDIDFLKSKPALFNEIIYLSNSDAFTNVHLLRRLKSMVKNGRIDFTIYPLSSIIYQLQTSPAKLDPSALSGVDLFSQYQFRIKDVPKQISILDDILDFINTDVSAYKPISKNNVENTLARKLSANFELGEKNKTVASYIKLWHQKTLVQQYIETRFSLKHSKILGLLETIQFRFRKLARFDNYNCEVEYSDVFDTIAEGLIPDKQHYNSDYFSMAKAVVLYFFEMCDFGARYVEEPPSFLDLKMSKNDTSE